MIVCGITGSTGVLGKKFIEKYKSKLKIVSFKGDITKKTDIEKWFKFNKFNLILHFAALVPTNLVEQNYNKAMKVNIEGTRNLSRVVLNQNSKIWFFFSSTSHVYKYKKGNKKITENDLLLPFTKYGYTKLKAEKLLVSEFKKNNKLNQLCIGRIFSFTSYNQKKNFFIPNITNKIKSKKNIKLINLNHFRDFISVNDICNAIFLLSKKNYSGIINICSGLTIKLELIAKIIATKLKKKIKLESSNKPTYIIGNNKKLKSLGWKQTENINNILKNYLLNKK